MRILIVDDHTLFREGLKFLLAELDPRVEFIEADRCAAIGGFVNGQQVDIVLLDLNLPDAKGIQGLARVRESLPEATIVSLSSEDDPRIILEVIEQGAAGFIPKSSSRQVLIAALRLVLAGGVYLPPHALQRPADRTVAEQKQPEINPLIHLTDRQREVLQLAVRGKSNKAIAREMNISDATVKAHLSACFRALGVKNRTEAVFATAGSGLSA